MKIVTCTLPNASTEINGVVFKETPDGMVSEPLASEVAAQFVVIPGYTVADFEVAPKAPAKDEEAPKAPAATSDAADQSPNAPPAAPKAPTKAEKAQKVPAASSGADQTPKE